MNTLYVVKDGLKNNGCIVNSSGEQVKNINYYLLTYGKGNEGYIEEKKPDNWLLYTQIGELETLRNISNGAIKNKSRLRYHNFSSFEECLEKLKDLCGGTLITICDSESFSSVTCL